MNYKKGFTLIELLVVIAIIGILAAIVLTSLGTAREKAKNASAQASMSSMRAEAELGVGQGGNYVDDICTSTATGGLGDLITAVEDNIGANSVDCFPASPVTAPTAWAAEVTLLGTPTQYFCADSSGFAGPSDGGLVSTNVACTKAP